MHAVLAALIRPISQRRRRPAWRPATRVSPWRGALLLAIASSLPAAWAGGVDRTAIDATVPPGKDFFHYANGTWIRNTTIPADRSSWGPFGKLDDQVTGETRRLIDQLDPAQASPDALRARTFYQAFLDEAGIEARGLAPLQAPLAAIDAIQDEASLATALGDGVAADVDPLNATRFATPNLLGLWVAPGLHDTSHYMPYLLQGGLSLPDRDFYVSSEPQKVALRTAFLRHVTQVFKLAGFTDAAPRAQAVVDLERRIAEGHSTREASEDVLKADQVWPQAEFQTRAPGLDWARFLAAAGLARAERIAVWHPDALVAEARLVHEVPLAVWRDWFRLHLLDSHAGVLPKDFDQEAFAFYGTTLAGTPQQQQRWKRALRATDAALGDAVGQLYVARHFPEASKRRIQEMVRGIIAAFDHRIAALRWMAPSTRAEARAKLRTLYVGIAYPDHWTSYEGLEIAADDPVGNIRRASRFHRDQELARLGQAVDRTVWCMEPQVVNAVNLPVQNALNFPAAILQPPYFDPSAPDAFNYGAIGAIIGHEISHSFDDQGAQFDSQGRLRNWWTPDDLAHFKASSAALVRQYSAYRPFADAAVNGQQTLSENIADVAGLSAAHDALQALRTAHRRRHTPAAATADEREFFVAYAQAWQSVEREQALRLQLVFDGHAPPMYRAFTVRNLDDWYRAFKVRPGQALYLAPKDRVRVW